MLKAQACEKTEMERTHDVPQGDGMAWAQVGQQLGRGRGACRVAVVTGAGSGVGRAIAIALARDGVELCLLGRDSTKLAATAAVARPFHRRPNSSST